MQLRHALGAAMAVVAAACDDAGTNAGGRTQVYLTDDPFPFHLVQRVDIHVVRLEASASADTITGQQWTEIAAPNRAFNLLELQAGTTTLLGEADLPAGQYRAVRLSINTSLSSITGIDGSKPTVRWPVRGELTLYAIVEDPLAVPPAGARIVIDFDVGRSFQILGDGFVFLPWIRAVDEAATGSVRGTVRQGTQATPLKDAVVSLYAGGHASNQTTWLAATGRTDAQGRYVIAYLRERIYEVVVEAPATIEGERGPCVTVEGVQVRAGSATTVDGTLPAPGVPCGTSGGGTEPDTSGSEPGNPGGPVATVTVSVHAPSDPSAIQAGDSLGFTAVLKDAAGVTLFGRSVSWTTSSEGIVKITGSFGQYAVGRAQAAGTAMVTATSEGKSGSVSVVVH
ncbi:MAG: DUF4382 domain-containing protein [Gemmatimonadetes bacterium]|nr:DUF4382 domain-containing protein [Gemmatimonadota bacterium]